MTSLRTERSAALQGCLAPLAGLKACATLSPRTPSLEKRIAREARRRRQTRSEVARAALEVGLGAGEPDLAVEARRQSLLVSRMRSERHALDFITHAADTTGWK